MAVLAPWAAGLQAAAPATFTPNPPPPPSTPEAAGLLNLGASLTAQGDFATAEIAYRQILQRRDFAASDQRTALLGLATMFRKADALTKAAAIYEKFLKEFPDDYRVPDAFLALGRTLREMGAYDLALTRFYSVINTTLKVTSQGFDHYALLAKTAQFEIAQTYYEEGDFDDAAKFFSRVQSLELAPTDRARAQFMTGCSQARGQDLADAVATLRGYLDEWPNDENAPEARYILATTLDALKRQPEALEVTLDLLRTERSRMASDPKTWSYWQRRTGNQLANSFFLRGDILNALRIYQDLIKLSPEPSWRLPATYQVALCYERLFQWDRARDAYRAVISGAAPKEGEPPVDSEITDLAQMANWRLQHMQWRNDFNRRLATMMSNTDDNAPKASDTPPSTSNPPPTS
jgi:TolA-binding protein